jgi:hypothetical protein
MLSSSQQTDQLNKLVELFDPIKRSIQLPLTDICSRAEFYDESPELLTSVCSMYYMSRLLMHASMVPILSGRPVESPAAGESVRKNVEIVLQQATAFTELLQRFIARDLDLTMLWPFSGHAAFVAGSVLVVRSPRYQCLSASALCQLAKCYSSGIKRWKVWWSLLNLSFKSHAC